MKDSEETEEDTQMKRGATPKGLVGYSTKIISPATQHDDGEYSYVDYRILKSGRRTTTREVMYDKVEKDKSSLIL